MSGIFTSSEGENSSHGGKINVNTGNLTISDGGVFNGQTFSKSEGGSININANTLSLINGGQLLTSTSSVGKAGEIRVNATNSITIAGVDQNFEKIY